MGDIIDFKSYKKYESTKRGDQFDFLTTGTLHEIIGYELTPENIAYLHERALEMNIKIIRKEEWFM